MARTDGRKGSKGSTRLPAEKPEMVTLKVTVSRDTARLIRLEAFGLDCSLGQVIEGLVRSAPRRFSLVDRGAKGQVGTQGQESPHATTAQDARGEATSLGLVRDSA
jgi:hypothetical protein